MQVFEKDFTLVAFDEDSEAIVTVAKLISTSDKVDIDIDDDMVGFFQTELDLDFGEHRKFSSDVDTANDVIRMLFSIEAEEALNSGENELSERGRMASNLINLIHGPYDNVEMDEDERLEDEKQVV